MSSSKYGLGVLDNTQDNVINQRVDQSNLASNRHYSVFINARHCGKFLAGGEIDHEQEIYDRLLTAGRILGMAEGDIRRQIRRGIAKGVLEPKVAPDKWSAPKTNSRRVELVNAWWAMVESTDGLRPSQRVLAKTLAERSIECKSNSFEGSYRTMALASGLGVMTIGKALEGIPNLQVKKGDRITGEPTVWTIKLEDIEPNCQTGTDPSYSTGSTSLYPSGKSGHALRHQAHNFWSGRYNDWLIFNHLLSPEAPEQRIGEIAESVGCHPTTAKRSLKRLVSFGLAEQLEEGYFRSSGTDELNENEHEIYDTQGARRKRFSQDRAKYYNWTIGRLLKSARLTVKWLPERIVSKLVGDAWRVVDSQTGEIITNPWKYVGSEFGV